MTGDKRRAVIIVITVTVVSNAVIWLASISRVLAAILDPG